MKPTIKDIIQAAWPGFLSAYSNKILPSHSRVVTDILRCRTEQMGGHLYSCTDCGHQHYAYHSCNNRHCPQCGNQNREKWLQKQMRFLLPCPHFMITFTVPESLRKIIRSNQKELYSLLFKVTAKTIKDFALNKKYLGGQTGVLSILHTWTRKLIYHPHVHCIVPAGALNLNETQWLKPKKPDFLFPAKPFKQHYRKNIEDAFKKPALYPKLPKSLWQEEWCVQFQHVGSGEKALEYLARYVFKTAITDARILSHQNQRVTCSYIDSETKTKENFNISEHEFLRRFLQHTLPKGFIRVRTYGLFNHSKKETLNIAKNLIGSIKTESKPSTISEHRPICSQCQEPMTWIKSIPRKSHIHPRAPP